VLVGVLLVVVVVAFLVEVVALVVVGALVEVDGVVPPKSMEMLYALTLNTASEPSNGSVPAPMLVKYWFVLKPSFATSHAKKSLMSPE
jgi:hypothetical protein